MKLVKTIVMQEVEIDGKDKFEIIKLTHYILDDGKETIEPVDPNVELWDSGLSVSDYKPSDADDNEENEDLELKADEPDMQVPQSKEQKKEKPGIVARNQVHLIREQDNNLNCDTFVNNSEALKCKASSNMHANSHSLFIFL